jgi:hypothetical protein
MAWGSAEERHHLPCTTVRFTSFAPLAYHCHC